MNIPKTQDMLKPDVCHYMELECIENNFKSGEPGI